MDRYLSPKRKKWVYFFTIITLVSASIGIAYVYEVYFNYRFTVVSANKVYRSGEMPPEELQKRVKQYGIKTVIDLRNQGDDHNNAIEKEHLAMKQVGVKHINLASQQVPRDETVDKFLKIMQEKKNLPVLIHCYHGIGRAVLYSAAYRIEFEGWSNGVFYNRKMTLFYNLNLTHPG